MYLRQNPDGTFSNVWSLADATHYHSGGGEFLPLPPWVPRPEPWEGFGKLRTESTPGSWGHSWGHSWGKSFFSHLNTYPFCEPMQQTQAVPKHLTTTFDTLPVDEQLNALWGACEQWCIDQHCYGPVHTENLAWEKIDGNWRLCVTLPSKSIPVLNCPMKERIRLADSWDDFKAEFERVASELRRDAGIAIRQLRKGL